MSLEPRILLDPTHEQNPGRRVRTPRPTSLAGKTVGLLDISKARGNIFLDELSDLLASRDIQVRRYAKPTYTRPASLSLRQTIAAECDILLEALAD